MHEEGSAPGYFIEFVKIYFIVSKITLYLKGAIINGGILYEYCQRENKELL